MGKMLETLQPNIVNAPVLFVGCGGIGSKIIRGVADRALHDDNTLLRFVCLDTDVNDILTIDKGANIRSVQTSSTSTIETYLKNDRTAKNEWFPENKMLDSKSVSEGAGQVRAISRLALNATIKEGKIIELYEAIDELFLKDGDKFKQAIRVMIASTAAGGTGSGIAMEVGMLIRHYINKNYPEAAVMIRGFLVMPGVMDVVIDTQDERESIRSNGYATIKEINAFMMKGSGFFDTVPELNRYKNLAITVPSANSGEEKLSNLPFDFCFLMDKTDSNSGNMIDLPQYIEFAAQAIYEQNIGPMNKSSSSKEDNVLKLCIRPESLGRCRFGGLGASKLVYPYEAIRTYLALNWVSASIIGASTDKNMTDDDREALIKDSWLQYDMQYREEHKHYEDNPAASEEPDIREVYVSAMLQGKEDSAGNNFTARLWKQNLNLKILETKEADGALPTESSPDRETLIDDIFDDVESSTQKVMKFYVASVIDEIIRSKLTSFDSTFSNNLRLAGKACAQGGLTHMKRYNSIKKVERLAIKDDVSKAAAALAKAIFCSKSPVNKSGLGPFMLERFVSANGKAMHPNAIRFMLYELSTFLNDARLRFSSGCDESSFNTAVKNIISGNAASKSQFDVSKTRFSKENSLEEMCESCDKKELYNDTDGQKCNNALGAYDDVVRKFLICKIGAAVCEVAIPAVNALIQAYQDFYNSFTQKINDIEKKKEDIVTSLQFRNGDYIHYLFGSKEMLDHLCANVDRPVDTGDAAAELYAKIFETVRENSYVQSRKAVGPFNFETSKDIFDDVIIGYYEQMVEESADVINVANILQAVKLEFNTDISMQLMSAAPGQRDRLKKALKTDENLTKYIRTKIEMCNNLASPGIKKNTQDEAREAKDIACSVAMEDGAGIRVNDYLPDAIRTNTVSAYELHFFRAVYNITPTQLSKLSAPSAEEIEDQFSLSSEGELDLPSAGDYFRVYQKYMDTIGPDSRTSAVITPHIDQRWNAISVLPELDMDYQKKLMSKIHKALLYGFIYSRIIMRPVSDEDPCEMIYKYLDQEEYKQELIVSNGTRCDILYEVLDALYFDRKAVSILRDYVNETRQKIKEIGCKKTEESTFFKELLALNRKRVIHQDKDVADEIISIFEIVLLYCNSVPAQNKDKSEMRIMINSIIEIIHDEIALFTSNPDTVMSRTAEVLIAQYKMFIESYKKNSSVLRIGIFSDDVVETAQGALIRFFKSKDLMKYVEMVRSLPIK